MIDCVKFGTPLVYKILQYTGLATNIYFLFHMVNLNLVFGRGITPISIWNQLCFLTNLNHVIIFIYHLWSVITIFKKAQRSPALKKMYQFVFNLSFFIALSYWSMRLVDQKLVHGKHTSAELGELYQLFIHGFNHFLLILEAFIEDKQSEWSSNIKQFVPFTLLYTIQVAVQFFAFGRNVYPFQKLLAPYGFLFPLAIIPVLLIINKLYTLNVFKFLSCKVVEDEKHKKHKAE